MTELCHLERQVAGGNQVFQVVVDTDDIATQISGLLYREKVRAVFASLRGPPEFSRCADSVLTVLQKSLPCVHRLRIALGACTSCEAGRKGPIPAQAGRVTFCPLNRVSAESVRYPADLGTDAQPLIGRLKFDGRFQKAVQQARPCAVTSEESAQHA